MAPRKPAQTAQRPFEDNRFYAVDLTRAVDWKGDALLPSQDLQVRGAVLNEIDADQPGAILDARPV